MKKIDSTFKITEDLLTLRITNNCFWLFTNTSHEKTIFSVADKICRKPRQNKIFCLGCLSFTAMRSSTSRLIHRFISNKLKNKIKFEFNNASQGSSSRMTSNFSHKNFHTTSLVKEVQDLACRTKIWKGLPLSVFKIWNILTDLPET